MLTFADQWASLFTCDGAESVNIGMGIFNTDMLYVFFLLLSKACAAQRCACWTKL